MIIIKKNSKLYIFYNLHLQRKEKKMDKKKKMVFTEKLKNYFQVIRK